LDHHVPAAIADGLISRGIDVLTTTSDQTERFDDESLLARATLLNRVLFSQDRDLLVIAHQWQQNKREFSGLIYAHQLAITIGKAVIDLELIAKALDPEDMINKVEFIPL
jgi:hypothetical protein